MLRQLEALGLLTMCSNENGGGINCWDTKTILSVIWKPYHILVFYSAHLRFRSAVKGGILGVRAPLKKICDCGLHQLGIQLVINPPFGAGKKIIYICSSDKPERVSFTISQSHPQVAWATIRLLLPASARRKFTRCCANRFCWFWRSNWCQQAEAANWVWQYGRRFYTIHKKSFTFDPGLTESLFVTVCLVSSLCVRVKRSWQGTILPQELLYHNSTSLCIWRVSIGFAEQRKVTDN